MTIDRNLLLLAAEWIETEAAMMRETTVDCFGQWPDPSFEDDYNDGITIAAELRREAGE
jgi:hypothetical protein